MTEIIEKRPGLGHLKKFEQPDVVELLGSPYSCQMFVWYRSLSNL